MAEKKKTITKADIVERVYHNIDFSENDAMGFSKKDASDLVEIIFDSLKGMLCEGKDVKIVRFGKFVVRDKSVRRGRNPKTKEQMWIPARRVLSFRVSRVFRDKINNKLLNNKLVDS